MSISIFKINIYKDLLSSEFINEDERIKISNLSETREFIFNEIDFDSTTIEDFIDNLDFMDSKICIFIVNKESKRFIELMKFINNKVEMEIVIYNSINKKNILGNMPYDMSTIEFKYKNSINLKERLNNSYNALNSGIYDLKEQVHIKHIKIDNIEDISLLDESIIMNTGLNSLIIYENELNDINKALPFSKILNINDFDKKIVEKNFRSIDIDKEKNYIHKFYENGILKFVKGLPKDINKYLSKGDLHSLFIKNRKIYYDSDYKIMLSEKMNINIYELLNKITNLNIITALNDRFIRNYFIANAISDYYEEDLKVITPLNKGVWPSVDEGAINTDYESCIGFIRKDGSKYIYNFVKNKMFKVSEKILIAFEAEIKNISIDKKEEENNKIKGMLKNVQ
ncbi:hypothetical protein ACUW5X_002150 [Staphylococcus hominis]|uniref:hypothetical protein n=1 Tax=Staphylococcus hominis TaxID=1290 RepID=UPI003F671627